MRKEKSQGKENVVQTDRQINARSISIFRIIFIRKSMHYQRLSIAHSCPDGEREESDDECQLMINEKQCFVYLWLLHQIQIARLDSNASGHGNDLILRFVFCGDERFGDR